MTLFLAVQYRCVQRERRYEVNSDQSECPIKELFASGEIHTLLEKYIRDCEIAGSDLSCRDTTTEQADLFDRNSRKQKKQTKCKSSFPNLAGFCRYLGIGSDELSELAEEYPKDYGRILTALEDEALNSALSPTLISSYLKKRLGYGSIKGSEACSSQVQIQFEHDIFEDGE